jgi:hypothetical protein
VYGLEWDHLSGSHGNIGTRADIDFELSFIADLKAAIAKARAENPFSKFVDPGAAAHTGFLSKFFATIAEQATASLRSKYGRLYGFEEATPPNDMRCRFLQYSDTRALASWSHHIRGCAGEGR